MHLVGRAGQGAEHPLCVLHAVGLAEDFAAHIHDGVTSQHHRAGMVFCHSEAFAPGSFSTSWAGVGAVTPLSSKSLTQMVKSVVYKLRSSFLRGLPEAKIRFISLSSFSFCPWPQGPAFYDSAGFFVLRGPTRHANGSPIRGAGCEAD